MPRATQTLEDALVKAIYAFDRAAVRSLLAKGANPNLPAGSRKYPALAWALSSYDSPQSRFLVPFLLRKGADPNQTAVGGASPLMLAVRDHACHPRLLQALLAAGANPNATDSAGNSPLMWAVCSAQPEDDITAAVSALLAAGANACIASQNGRTPALAAIASDRSVACIKELVQAQLAQGLGLDETLILRTSAGEYVATTLLITASALRPQVAKMLLELGAAPKACPKKPDDLMATVMPEPLCNAVREGALESAKALVDAGADIHQVDREGRTLLWRAIRKGQEDLALWLLEQGVCPHLADNKGATALMVCCSSGVFMPPVLEALIRRGVDPLAIDTLGNSALDHASQDNLALGILQPYVASHQSARQLDKHTSFPPSPRSPVRL